MNIFVAMAYMWDGQTWWSFVTICILLVCNILCVIIVYKTDFVATSNKSKHKNNHSLHQNKSSNSAKYNNKHSSSAKRLNIVPFSLYMLLTFLGLGLPISYIEAVINGYVEVNANFLNFYDLSVTMLHHRLGAIVVITQSYFLGPWKWYTAQKKTDSDLSQGVWNLIKFSIFISCVNIAVQSVKHVLTLKQWVFRLANRGFALKISVFFMICSDFYLRTFCVISLISKHDLYWYGMCACAGKTALVLTYGWIEWNWGNGRE
eukprot:UN33685